MEQLTPEVLTGVATLEYLAGLGAAFCLTDGKFGRKPCDNYGQPLPGNYQDMPQPLSVASAHLRQRGAGVGVLTHLSAGLTLLDIDAGLEAFLAMFPALADAPRIIRSNAADRGKIILFVAEQGGKIMRQDAEMPTRKAELLGRGHANVAGRHPSGALYELQTGTLLVFTRQEIEAMLSEWIPDPYEPAGRSAQANPRASLLQKQTPTRSDGDLLHDAIAWFNTQFQNIAAVDQLIAARPHRGGYFSSRPDDRTASTKRSGNGQTWFDYGTQETLDVFEMHCRLNGINKATFKWEVVDQWRVSQGKQPLNSTSRPPGHPGGLN